MEERKKIIAAGLTFMVLVMQLQLCQAQRKERIKIKIWDVRKGCIRAQGNLAPGYLFGQKDVTAYVNGDVDLFLDDRTSVFGSIWASFNMGNNPKGLTANHAVFFGINYHFLKPTRFDPYVGLTPGFGLVRANYINVEGETQKTNFCPVPLIAAAVGCNYYVGSIFHFFIKAQFTAGQMFSTLPEVKRIDELKITAGLGWNARVWRPKKRDKWKGTIPSDK